MQEFNSRVGNGNTFPINVVISQNMYNQRFDKNEIWRKSWDSIRTPIIHCYLVKNNIKMKTCLLLLGIGLIYTIIMGFIKIFWPHHFSGNHPGIANAHVQYNFFQEC